MSLIGSLEDLNLGDILQIIYLSQKSGALVIRSDEGQGRILFREGLVCGGSVKGGPTDLRSLLVGGGFVAEADFAELADACPGDVGALEAALKDRALITAERLDSLRRESVESAVAKMFHWTTGEFSFDLQREADSEECELLLRKGINPQFLAMERVRLEDESGRAYDEADEFDDDDPNEMSAEEMFGVAASAPASQPSESVHELARMTTERADAEEEAEPVDGLLDADLIEASAELDPEVSPPIQRPAAPPVIAIDPDLAVLEWVKESLKRVVPKVHIFQDSEQGLHRIRQYLVRAKVPLVLMSPDVQGDRSTGIADASDFALRLKGQSAGLRVFWLCEDAVESTPPQVGEGSVTRPSARAFRNPGAARRREELAVALRDALLGPPANDATRITPTPAKTSEGDVASEIDRSLDAASSRGEILPLVLEQALQSFSRVAMFIVRDDLVIGVAQRGLDACGGPDDHGMRALNFQGENSAWLRAALMTRRPLVAAPQGDGDFELARSLGERAPREAFVAPLESDGQVIALLYADNLPGDQPIGDTSGIERTLEHAGRAFDREVRERTAGSDA